MNIEKKMIVVHELCMKEGYDKRIIDVDSIISVYYDLHGTTCIRYTLGEVEIKETIDDVIKKLVACGVNIDGNYETN